MPEAIACSISRSCLLITLISLELYSCPGWVCPSGSSFSHWVLPLPNHGWALDSIFGPLLLFMQFFHLDFSGFNYHLNDYMFQVFISTYIINYLLKAVITFFPLKTNCICCCQIFLVPEMKWSCFPPPLFLAFLSLQWYSWFSQSSKYIGFLFFPSKTNIIVETLF